MKIVKETDKKLYRFTCKYCGNLLEATTDDFRFVQKGVLQYYCPKCRTDLYVKERRLTIIPVFEEIKLIRVNSEGKKAQ